MGAAEIAGARRIGFAVTKKFGTSAPRVSHRARLGYPFGSLTPSYATALGASGDRPAALAELMGIIVNRGLRLPVTRVASLQFARGTPYETHLEYQPTAELDDRK